MKKTVRNDDAIVSFLPAVDGGDSPERWITRFLMQLEKAKSAPSRKTVHILRRLCRIGRALAEVPSLKNDPVFSGMERRLSRTLKVSRSLRNADVLRKFLSREKIDLEEPLSRKKLFEKFRRHLSRLWGPESEKTFGREVGKMFRRLKQHPPERGLRGEEEFSSALGELAAFYPLWSSGTEDSFEAIHAIRIRLKGIDGRELWISWGALSGPALEKVRREDLRKILRLLGRMSDLLTMEEMASGLSGQKKEKRRFLRKIKAGIAGTDRKILRFLESGAIRAFSHIKE